jgi:hypothetical protein
MIPTQASDLVKMRVESERQLAEVEELLASLSLSLSLSRPSKLFGGRTSRSGRCSGTWRTCAF